MIYTQYMVESCYELSHGPLKFIGSIRQCDYMWKQGFEEVIKIKLGHKGGVLLLQHWSFSQTFRTVRKYIYVVKPPGLCYFAMAA